MEITVPIPSLSTFQWILVMYAVGVAITFFVTAMLSRYKICAFDGNGSPPAAIVILLWPLAIVVSVIFGIFGIFCLIWNKLANR